MDTTQMEAYNANYVGGDINGGVIDIGQLFTRPALRYSPYKTSAEGHLFVLGINPSGGRGAWHVRVLVGQKSAERCVRYFG
jgi:hypothetical protein